VSYEQIFKFAPIQRWAPLFQPQPRGLKRQLTWQSQSMLPMCCYLRLLPRFFRWLHVRPKPGTHYTLPMFTGREHGLCELIDRRPSDIQQP